MMAYRVGKVPHFPAARRVRGNQERQELMASKNVVEFTSDNWAQEVEQSDKPVLVDFWAPWCGPCRQLGPTIDRIADQFAGKVKVGKLNVDEAPDVATRFGVTSIPRVFIFKGSDKPRKQVVGLTSENELVKSINEVMQP
jgi:thioredoxin 1